ncbi:MAG: hypothetical protein BMS9Abin36_0201 [Gammaproteobacteria bacterium]|nr:MAG: hypothetical protein BMS9Abin36_0201 [Gammaproteobacteria bacterium]
MLSSLGASLRQRFVTAGPARLTLYIVLASTLLHLLVAGRVGLGSDEAHYALYAWYLDWSYFDHPPLVGWLQALVLPFSQSEFALRLIPMLLFAASSAVLYRLSQRLFPESAPWVGLCSVAMMHLGIMFQLIGLSMLPEAPLLLFGMLSLLALYRIGEQDALKDWLLLGVSLGLAGLSKYTAIALVITALAYLGPILGWRLLWNRGAWLATVIALLLITPVLYWNSQHDWVSFLYQLNHGFKPRDWSIGRALSSQGGQMFAYSPALYVAVIIAVFSLRKSWRHKGVRLTFLALLPILLLFVWGSGYEITLPHWTALAWVSVLPLVSHWMVTGWQQRSRRIIVWGALLYSIPVILILHSELFIPWLPFPDNKYPFAPLYGWQVVADKAEAYRRKMAGTPGPEPVLLVNNWSLASRLAWYARPVVVQVQDRRMDQFDLWYGAPRQGSRGIMVVPVQYKTPRTGDRGQFTSCKLLSALPWKVHGSIVTTYSFYQCFDFHE